MTTEIISQKARKTCDGCGKVVEMELIGLMDDTSNGVREREAYEQWYTVIREVFSERDGRFVKMASQACSLDCVPAAAVKLALPPEENSPIDLRSLQTGGAN